MVIRGLIFEIIWNDYRTLLSLTILSKTIVTLRIFSVSIPRALVLLILFNLKPIKGECSYYKYIKKLSLNPTPWHLPSYTYDANNYIQNVYFLVGLNDFDNYKSVKRGLNFMIYVFTPLCISSKIINIEIVKLFF